MKTKTVKTLIVTIAITSALNLSSGAEPAELWGKHCASCHGKDGRGQTKMGAKAGVKDYTDAKIQDAMKDDVAFKAVKDGLKEKDKELMKPFAEKLADDEIKSLIAYMRTFKK
jgi:cytochrome c553